jgi:glycosyltransferase involved in cell wall biosynthesis
VPQVIDRAAARSKEERDPPRHFVDLCIGHFNAESAFLDNTWHRSMAVECKYSIGYWAWELAEYPDEWMNAFLFYDEIWASTEFARAAFASKSPRPVHLMPMVVENPAIDGSLNRDYFGLPTDRFLLFFHFDFRSFVERKNPDAAIRAFLEAFPTGAESVGLVIKTLNGEHDPAGWARVTSLASTDSRIQIINREFTRLEVTSLIGACDCYVSLHRSEGFGRGLAEAMLLEKPVITTSYSGNMDFCSAETTFLVDYDLVPVREHDYIGTKNQVWADAKVGHAAEVMRTVYGNKELRERVARQGAAMIRAKYSPEVVGALYAHRLNEIMKQSINTSPSPQRTAPSASTERSRWANLLGIFTDKDAHR